MVWPADIPPFAEGRNEGVEAVSEISTERHAGGVGQELSHVRSRRRLRTQSVRLCLTIAALLIVATSVSADSASAYISEDQVPTHYSNGDPIPELRRERLTKVDLPQALSNTSHNAPQAVTDGAERIRAYERGLSGDGLKKRVRESLLKARGPGNLLKRPTPASVAIAAASTVILWKAGDLLVESQVPGVGSSSVAQPYDLKRCLANDPNFTGTGCFGRNPWDALGSQFVTGQVPTAGDTYWAVRRTYSNPAEPGTRVYWYTGDGTWPGGDCSSAIGTEPPPAGGGQVFTVKSDGMYCTHSVQWFTSQQVWDNIVSPIREAIGGPAPIVEAESPTYPGDNAVRRAIIDCVVKRVRACLDAIAVDEHVNAGAPDPALLGLIEFPYVDRHWEDHREKFSTPYEDVMEYWRDAADIVERGRRHEGAIEECERPVDGALIYWDFDKDAWVIVKDGKIVTYYPPDGGYADYRLECERTDW